MFNKNDPLINSVTKVMQENQARRDAITVINEAFGITDKRHLPFQAHAEYDALVEEMTQEALVGGQAKLDVNRNNRLDKQDFKMLRGMKKKPMAENPEETAKSVKTAADVQNSNKDMSEAMSALAGTTGVQTASGSTGAGAASSAGTKGAGGSSPTKPVIPPKPKNYTTVKLEEEEVDEATLSAKAARAGKDIGKKGKMFAKIAASAAKRYGSEERGKKVAGAILKKMRAKAGMEEEKLDEFIAANPYDKPRPDPLTAFRQNQVNQTGAAIKRFVGGIQDPKKKADVQNFVGGLEKSAEPTLKQQGLQTPTMVTKPNPATVPGGDAAKDAAVARNRTQANINPRTGPDANMAPKTGMMAPKVAAPKPAAPKPAAKPIPPGMHMRVSNFAGGTGLRSNALIGGGGGSGKKN